MELKSVIGLDPGSEKSAFIHWDGKRILNKGIHPNEYLLNLLNGVFWHQFKSTTIAPVLAVESMVHITNNAGKEIIDTIFWSGRFYQAWQGKKELVPRYKVRIALCGKMQSNDKVVRDILISRFGAPGTKKNPNPVTYGLKSHLWAAFALAVTHMDHLTFQERELK